MPGDVVGDLRLLLGVDPAGVATGMRRGQSLVDTGLRGMERSAATRLQTTGAHLTRTGALLSVGVGVPALLVGKHIMDSTLAFERGTGAMRAATRATDAELRRLSDAALDVRGALATGIVPAETQQAIVELGFAGLKTEQILGGALRATQNLAAASQGEVKVGDAAGYAVNWMTMFGRAAEDIPALVDAVASASANSTAKIGGLAQALQQSGAVARAAGLSFEETVGVLAGFDQMGLKGSDAGTSLKTMLMRLTPSSKEAADTMKELGLSFTDAQGKFVSVEQVAARLQERLAGLSDERRVQALTAIFGADAIRAANNLASMGAEGVRKWVATARDSGAAAETMRLAQQSVPGSLQRIGAAAEAMAIKVGDSLAAEAAPALEAFIGEVDRAAADGSLNAAAANWAKTLMGLAPAVGGAAQMMGGMARVFAALPVPMQSSLLLLTALAGPLTTLGGLATSVAGKVAALFEAMGRRRALGLAGDGFASAQASYAQAAARAQAARALAGEVAASGTATAATQRHTAAVAADAEAEALRAQVALGKFSQVAAREAELAAVAVESAKGRLAGATTAKAEALATHEATKATVAAIAADKAFTTEEVQLARARQAETAAALRSAATAERSAAARLTEAEAAAAQATGTAAAAKAGQANLGIVGRLGGAMGVLGIAVGVATVALGIYEWQQARAREASMAHIRELEREEAALRATADATRTQVQVIQTELDILRPVAERYEAALAAKGRAQKGTRAYAEASKRLQTVEAELAPMLRGVDGALGAHGEVLVDTKGKVIGLRMETEKLIEKQKEQRLNDARLAAGAAATKLATRRKEVNDAAFAESAYDDELRYQVGRAMARERGGAGPRDTFAAPESYLTPEQMPEFNSRLYAARMQRYLDRNTAVAQELAALEEDRRLKQAEVDLLSGTVAQEKQLLDTQVRNRMDAGARLRKALDAAKGDATAGAAAMALDAGKPEGLRQYVADALAAMQSADPQVQALGAAMVARWNATMASLPAATQVQMRQAMEAVSAETAGLQSDLARLKTAYTGTVAEMAAALRAAGPGSAFGQQFVADMVAALASGDPAMQAQGRRMMEAFTAGEQSGSAQARGQWQTLLQEVRQRVSAANAFGWGANLMREFGQGMQSEIPTVQHFANAAAQATADMLEAHSPPKTGPLHTIDRWGGPLMESYAEGIRAGAPAVAAALREVIPHPLPLSQGERGAIAGPDLSRLDAARMVLAGERGGAGRDVPAGIPVLLDVTQRIDGDGNLLPLVVKATKGTVRVMQARGEV